MFRVERPGAMSINFGLRHEIKNSVIGQRDNFIDFVGRAETIKEMNKWHAALQRCDVQMRAKSCASWTLAAHNIAQPVWRTAITSE